MKKFTIHRATYSPYFKNNFRELEIHELSKFGEFQLEQNPSPNILITNTETNLLDLQNSGALKKTQLIIHPNSGYDNFPLKFIQSTEIPIILGNPIRQEAVTNYFLSCLFEHSQTIPWKKNWEEARKWDRPQLSTKNGLIIGYGHVGEMLEKRLQLLLKKVFIHDPNKHLDQIHVKNEVDYIFVCADLNEQTKNMINMDFLKDLKKDVTIINPARGKIIQLQDLITFLQKNPDAFAFLDVYPTEPYPLNDIYAEIKDQQNIKASCHVAGVFDKIDEAIIKFESEIIESFIELKRDEFLTKYKNLHLQNILGM